MQNEKPLNPNILIANALSRQRTSAERDAKETDASELTRLARERFHQERSARSGLYYSGNAEARANAPWAFDIIDEFSKKVNTVDKCARLNIALEFNHFEIMRGPKKVDDYVGGLLHATLHLEAEPDLSVKEKRRWVEVMAENIIRNSNGIVSRQTGVRNPHNQKGMIVEFISRFGVEHAEQGNGTSLNKAYAQTPRKEEEMREFFGFIENTITRYNKAVSDYPKAHENAELQINEYLAGIART